MALANLITGGNVLLTLSFFGIIIGGVLFAIAIGLIFAFTSLHINSSAKKDDKPELKKSTEKYFITLLIVGIIIAIVSIPLFVLSFHFYSLFRNVRNTTKVEGMEKNENRIVQLMHVALLIFGTFAMIALLFLVALIIFYIVIRKDETKEESKKTLEIMIFVAVVVFAFLMIAGLLLWGLETFLKNDRDRIVGQLKEKKDTEMRPV